MPKKVLHGTAVCDAVNKTVKVAVLRVYKHKLYKKAIKKHKNYAVHDENSVCKKGDNVFICESKPISATKKWIIFDSTAR